VGKLGCVRFARRNYSVWKGFFYSPEDMKKGILKRPESTRSRRACSVLASKGKAPQTST